MKPIEQPVVRVKQWIPRLVERPTGAACVLHTGARPSRACCQSLNSGSKLLWRDWLHVFPPQRHTLVSVAIWHAIRGDHGLLTKLALPVDLLLTVGPLANVDMEGRRVPPKAISTSFGGCLKSNRKHLNSSRGDPGAASALGCSPRADTLQSDVVMKKKSFKGPHLIYGNLCVQSFRRFFGVIALVRYPPCLKFLLRVARRTICSRTWCRWRARLVESSETDLSYFYFLFLFFALKQFLNGKTEWRQTGESLAPVAMQGPAAWTEKTAWEVSLNHWSWTRLRCPATGAEKH